MPNFSILPILLFLCLPVFPPFFVTPDSLCLRLLGDNSTDRNDKKQYFVKSQSENHELWQDEPYFYPDTHLYTRQDPLPGGDKAKMAFRPSNCV